MEYGAHRVRRRPADAGRRHPYARTAAALDFRFLCANDHLRFGRPWLHGPTALAAALEASAPAAS